MWRVGMYEESRSVVLLDDEYVYGEDFGLNMY